MQSPIVLEPPPAAPASKDAPHGLAAPPPETTSARAHDPTLGTAGGQLAGWLMVALTSTAMILSLPAPASGVQVRVAHCVYDLGLFAAAALLVSSAAEAWGAWGPRRAVWGYFTAWLAALSVGALVLGDDLGGLADTLGGGTSKRLRIGALVALAALAIPGAAFAGRLLARPWLRLTGLLAGVAAAVANHFVLELDYAGVHLFLGWSAATLFGASLVGVRLPRAGLFAAPLRARAALRGAAALASAATLIVPPRAAVQNEMLKVNGSFLAGHAARLRVLLRERMLPPALPTRPSAEWFGDRSALSPVPPTGPRLLPDDGVVVLVTVDCMRADVLSVSRYRKYVPRLAALADEAVQFRNARSTAPSTAISLSSIFASRYYSQLYFTDIERRGSTKLMPHEDRSPRFSDLLGRSGVRTVHFSGDPWISGESGMVPGFTDETLVPQGERKWAMANELIPRLVSALENHREGPLFAYAHMLDAHAPYERGGKKGSPMTRYLRELSVVDRQIGVLLDAIERGGLRNRTAVIVTADHGEAFGEHGSRFHGRTMYDELLRVPLLIRAPSVAPRRSDVAVTLVDLAPTVLDMMGLPSPPTFMGQSLVPLLRGGAASYLTRPIFADSGRLKQALVFPDGVKIIRDRRTGSVEMYDLAKDPDELADVFEAGGEQAEVRLRTLEAFFEAHRLKRAGYAPPYRP